MMQFFQHKNFLGLILALLLTACSQLPLITGHDSLTTSHSTNPTTGPAVQMKPCRLGTAEAQCGTLKVYENRAALSGRMIDLKIAVIKAHSDHPAPDPIFYLAGGPGDAATEDGARGQQFPTSLSENHDLVFVDQRGTGGSNRVLVPNNPPDLTGLTPEKIDARIKEWVAGYLKGIDMDPRFYTTSMAMDDLDEVREALGYAKINLFGASYGVTAAQYYLRQHEEHVRAVFLYGGSLLDIPVFERWAHSSQRALDIYFDLCRANSACQAAFPNLRAEFSALLERLAKEPVTQSYTNPNDGQPATTTFTSDYFAAVIRAMLKDAKNASRLPLLIQRAYLDNDFMEFTRFGSEWWGEQMMERVIRCGEKWAVFNPDAVARLGENSFLKSWDVSLAQNQAFTCQYTPRGKMPEGLELQTGSQAPVLVINSELDPIDPPENMAGAKALWPNSLSLVLPYHGHSLSDYESVMCLWSIENEFIQSGSVNGLKTDCLQSLQPPTFDIPAAQVLPSPTNSAPSTLVPPESPGPAYTTSLGDFEIKAARFVDQVNGVMPGPDENLLLIAIRKPGQAKLNPSSFSLQDFDKALRDQTNGKVHIAEDDGSYAVCSMTGWVGENYQAFAMGFEPGFSGSKLNLLCRTHHPFGGWLRIFDRIQS